MGLGVGCAVGIVCWGHYRLESPGGMSDFDQVWIAARALRSGADPYAALQQTGWPFPLYYPLTAAVLALPLTLLSAVWARIVFFALGSAMCSYALSARPHRLFALLSGSFFQALLLAQWGPLLVGATGTGLLLAGGIWSAKPTAGLALAIYAARTRRAWVAVACGALIVGLISLALRPSWPLSFLADARHASHIRPLVGILPLGPLVLLAALRWRRPEARLLIALACIPQTVALYTTLPLFLVPRTRRQTLVLVLLSDAAFALTMWGIPAWWPQYRGSLVASAPIIGTCLLALLYLPCLLMIWRRPNVAEQNAAAAPSGRAAAA